MDERGKLNLQSSIPRLFNLSTVDIWGPIILSWGKRRGCPVLPVVEEPGRRTWAAVRAGQSKGLDWEEKKKTSWNG